MRSCVCVCMRARVCTHLCCDAQLFTQYLKMVNSYSLHTWYVDVPYKEEAYCFWWSFTFKFQFQFLMGSSHSVHFKFKTKKTTKKRNQGLIQQCEETNLLLFALSSRYVTNSANVLRIMYRNCMKQSSGC